MESICDYWDNHIVEIITALLNEYSDMFPVKFLEMKRLARELGDMNIPLKLDSRPIRKRPYRLNPMYKQKVKEKIVKMLEVSVIEPVEESEWIIHMVVKETK
jgi:hypothetical protein